MSVCCPLKGGANLFIVCLSPSILIFLVYSRLYWPHQILLVLRFAQEGGGMLLITWGGVQQWTRQLSLPLSLLPQIDILVPSKGSVGVWPGGASVREEGGGGRVRVYKSSETRSSGHVRRTYLHRKVRSSSADSSIGHRSYWDMAERNIPFTVHRSPSWDPWHQVSRLFDQGFGMPPLNEDFSTFPNAHWPGYVRAPFMSPEMGALLHHPPHTVHPSHLMGHRALSRQLSSGLSEIKQTQDNWKVALDVSHFSPEELVVKTKDGILEISGENPFMSIKSNLCSYALVKGCDWDPNTVHVSEQWVSPAEKHLQLYEQRTLLVWFKKIHRIQWEGNFRSHWGRMHSWWTS